MSAIAMMAKQAAYGAVYGEGLVKFSEDSHVPADVLVAMVKLSGAPLQVVADLALEHPEEFYKCAAEMEKVAVPILGEAGRAMDAANKAKQLILPQGMKAPGFLERLKGWAGANKGKLIGGGAGAGVGGVGAALGLAGGGQSAAPESPGLTPGGAAAAETAAVPSPKGPSLGPTGGGIMDWIMANKGKAALLGLGGAGAAYGLTSLLGSKKKKEAYAGDKGALLKQAHDVARRNAVAILGRHLTKLAGENTTMPKLRKQFNTVHAMLLAGHTIKQAMDTAFPKMSPQQREHLAGRLAKKAMDSFLKEACFPGCKKGGAKGATSFPGAHRTKSEKSFRGKPGDAMGFMKGAAAK